MSENKQNSPQESGSGQVKEGENGTGPQIVDFSNLILGFATAALYHLGEVPIDDKTSEKKDTQLAKQNIDIIDMLKEKTAGNLNNQEQKLVDSMLTDLKLKYASQT